MSKLARGRRPPSILPPKEMCTLASIHAAGCASTKSPVLVQRILPYGALSACARSVVRSQSPILRQNCSFHMAVMEEVS